MKPFVSQEKPLHWVGSAKKDLLAFPGEAVDDFGYALGVVQLGGIPPSAKPWKGEGPGVFEIVRRYLPGGLHGALRESGLCAALLSEKTPSGMRTAKNDVDLIHERLKTAQADYEAHYGKDN